MNMLTTAQIFVKLMDRLGYKKFYAQGGDWGAGITTDIATFFPDRFANDLTLRIIINTLALIIRKMQLHLFPPLVYSLLGLHLNMAFANTFGTSFKHMIGSILPSGTVMDKDLEKHWYPIFNYYRVLFRELGYAHLHATKPDTVGQ